ncbi:MAG: flagellar protein FlgN [Armatimonadota bacterium]
MTQLPARAASAALDELLDAALAATVEQVECCTRMASLLESEHLCLVSRDIDGLRDSCRRIREAAQRLAAIDLRRQRAGEAVARAAGIEPREMCISQAMRLSDERGKIRWARVKRDLGRAARRVHMLNTLNQEWLRDELAYVRFIRDVVVGDSAPQTYDEESRTIAPRTHPALLSSAS